MPLLCPSLSITCNPALIRHPVYRFTHSDAKYCILTSTICTLTINLRHFDAGVAMSNLGLETVSAAPATKKKTLWDTVTKVGLSVVILAFFYIVISNMYLLYMGKPLI